MSDNMISCIAALTCKELAEISYASYFTGHWQPGLLPVLFENSKGQSWKVSNVIDQELRKRLKTPHNIQIHEGKFRVTFSNKNCWLWNEFSLATEDNLDIFKNCNLPFGEKTLDNSAHKLAAMCNDLWPDVSAMPDNDLYNEFKALKKAKLKRDLIKDESNFDKWLVADSGRTNDLKKAKTQYYKELDLTHINAQIKTIKTTIYMVDAG